MPTASKSAPDLAVTALRVRAAGGRALMALDQLAIAGGERVAITGPSGAGKSTLLFALAGLVAVEGQILWGGRDITAMPSTERTTFRAASFGMIFQDHLLFEELSPAQNAGLAALFAPRKARAGIRAEAAALLAAQGLAAEETRSVASHSGGERQRIAAARALAHTPPVILADEPTASLDRTNAARLTQNLFARAEETGATLIVASHDENVLTTAERVLTLQDGTLSDDTKAPAQT